MPSLTGLYPDRDNCYQLKEGAVAGMEESDSLIVVRDGKADHVAKEWTDIHRNQSTHARERNVPKRSMLSSLIALNRKALKEPEYRFRPLWAT